MLAIDLGEKKHGVAVSDPLRMVARGLCVIKRLSRKEDFVRFGRLIEENDVKLIVMGLPTYLDGSDSDQTRWVRDYAAELAENVPVPVVFHDEALTSKMAVETLVSRKQWRKKRDQLDAVAAAHILQDFLDG